MDDNARTTASKQLVDRARQALAARGVPLTAGEAPGFAVVWGGYAFGSAGGWLSIPWRTSSSGLPAAPPAGHEEAARAALHAEGFRAVWVGGERPEIRAWLGPA